MKHFPSKDHILTLVQMEELTKLRTLQTKTVTELVENTYQRILNNFYKN